jgi:YgiT-type zinc finger domain-containing protein
MRCEVCGAELAAITTDLPFKVREPGIVILKGLPVLQCARCPQYLLQDAVLARGDEILRRVDAGIEIEVIRYAA